MRQLAFDLFCHVIDNHGDAGVCWRLARALAARGHAVRLWLDVYGALARLLPGLGEQPHAQRLAGVEILPWDEAAQSRPPTGGIVIEAFGCTLPAAYRAQMAACACLWINLEYLSAEDWVEGCHGLPSPQPDGTPKYFYFPGFTQRTGGLLREPDLTRRRDQARRRPRGERLLDLLGARAGAIGEQARCMLLFGYPDAPAAGLARALGQASQPTWLLVPGTVPAGLQEQGNLRILPIPFVPQARFDELLWCCDLNFVRGEDSLVRALWAATPHVWHVYRQADEAHLAKLEAWMRQLAWPEPVCALQRAWNRGDDEAVALALGATLQPLSRAAWLAHCRAQAARLAGQPDLAQRLVTFCESRLQTR